LSDDCESTPNAFGQISDFVYRRAEDCPPTYHVHSLFAGRVRHPCAPSRIAAVAKSHSVVMLPAGLDKIATENVTMVPKQIHQGFITGSQSLSVQLTAEQAGNFVR